VFELPSGGASAPAQPGIGRVSGSIPVERVGVRARVKNPENEFGNPCLRFDEVHPKLEMLTYCDHSPLHVGPATALHTLAFPDRQMKPQLFLHQVRQSDHFDPRQNTGLQVFFDRQGYGTRAILVKTLRVRLPVHRQFVLNGYPNGSGHFRGRRVVPLEQRSSSAPLKHQWATENASLHDVPSLVEYSLEDYGSLDSERSKDTRVIERGKME
jgi:hypothetical protein